MSAPSAPAKRRRQRRSPWRFLREDWGLLLLSALLTYSVWNAVRDEVLITDIVEGVPVTVEQPPEDAGYRVVLPRDAKIDVRLSCSKPKFAELSSLLLKEGIELQVRRGLIPGANERPINIGVNADDDRYVLPFPNHFLASRDAAALPAPETARVIAIQRIALPIAKPTLAAGGETGPKPGWTLETVRIDPKVWDRPQPRGLVIVDERSNASLEDLKPDPIPLEAIRDWELDKEYVIELSFSTWKQDRDARQHANLPKPGAVRATLVKRSSHERLLKNDLWIGIDTSVYEIDFNGVGTLQALGLSAEDGNRLIHARTQFTGRLRGSREVLARLAENKDLWCWQLVVDPSILPADGETVTEGRLRFVPLGLTRGPRPEFAPAQEETRSVQITIKRREGQ